MIFENHIKQLKKTGMRLQSVVASIVRLPVLLCALVFLGIPYFAAPAWAQDFLEAPHFEKVVVADHQDDGYWVEAVDINDDQLPDLVTSGLTVGKVVWYENPTWEKHYITTLPKPVALAQGDIDQDGWIDLVISHDYGACMFNCGPNDGKISWLRNPGNRRREWQLYHIGDLVATHRLQLGHFTTKDELQLLAVPVVGSEGVESPVPITLYTKPYNLLQANEWPSEIVNRSFRVIHGVVPYNSGGKFDSVLLASEDGIHTLSLDKHSQSFTNLIGEGEHGQSEFKGSGNVAIGYFRGKAPSDRYFPAIEPFHGNTIAFYTPIDKNQYERTVLEVFGPEGEAVGHHVVTANFDFDDDDEFLVAERGPSPWQGVAYYDPFLNENLKIEFKKTQLSDSSAARIAVADFDGDGIQDFATTGYYTEGYFLADNSQVLVFLNRWWDY